MRLNDKNKNLLDRLISKKAIIDNHRPFSNTVLQRLREDWLLEWTYNSNAIEGNSLSIGETKMVLLHGLAIGGKSIREHFEAINHGSAIELLEDMVAQDALFAVSDLLDLHSLILRNIDLDYAGRFRTGRVRVLGANFVPPPPYKISFLMDELFDQLHQDFNELEAPVLAAWFHHRLVHIHPFFDGNGRTARLAMNLILMKKGFPPAIILKNDRIKYFNALNLANKGNYDKLFLLVFQATERSLNMYLNSLPGHYDDYLPLSAIAEEKGVPYGADYISLLARRGLIDAHKEGRNWLTTKKAVLDYISKV
ncbi:MAG: Fic family protein [Saprospirales bacterium]|nr:MAG: Fic family protein [Saprospirales bacterium]